MKVHISVQRHLVVGHLAEDSGEWLFTLCRVGLSKLLGERLRLGEQYEIEVSGKIVEQLSNEDDRWIKRWLREDDVKTTNVLPSPTENSSYGGAIQGRPETD